nr:orotidine-5'-phosphate decarboxylase [Paenibacillus oenotherae]
MADMLIEQSREKKSVLVVGLDPDPRYFPEFLLNRMESRTNEEIAAAILAFNRIVIDAVAEEVVAVKPQLAYYEVYGSHGIHALEQTIAYARTKGLLVINDAKRGDIGSSSEAYAKAFLADGPMAGDMVTVNPFLGSDGYLPFVEEAQRQGKGLFLLLKTSNPSSHEIQNLTLQNGDLLYFKLAEDLSELMRTTAGENGYSFIGAVVGATYPAEAERIRGLLPHCIFLVPGFGIQGGKAEDLDVFFDENGNGALISSSRAIIYSYREGRENGEATTEQEMLQAIKNAARTAKEQINEVRLHSSANRG